MTINHLSNLTPDVLFPLKDLRLPPLKQDQMAKLIQARVNIAELNGYCKALPNPMLLLAPSFIKESLASSEIENIQSTLIIALQNMMFPELERTKADKEILRYKEAINHGYQDILSGLPLISRVIIGVQNQLIPSKNGGFRKVQNAIWNPSTKEVLLVPPVSTDIPELVKDWEIFVNQNTELDPLIKNAIAHYQFESIHPFEDGNGRTGRILMVLGLVQDNLIDLPILYLSGYIAKHKNTYYTTLQSVRKNQDWTAYIDFMLDVFINQAKETKETFVKMIDLLELQKTELKIKLPKIYSKDLIEAIYTSPVTTPANLATQLKIHYTTASKYLKSLEKAGIVTTQRVGKYQFYTNQALVEILNV
jgi:Fic family protein